MPVPSCILILNPESQKEIATSMSRKGEKQINTKKIL